MKKRFFAILSSLFFLFAFISCNNLTSSTSGAVSITLPGKSPRIAVPSDLSTYTINLYNSESLTADSTAALSKTAAPGASVTFDDLDPGVWTVVVYAYNSSNEEIAKGTSSVTVTAGATSTADIHLKITSKDYSFTSFTAELADSSKYVLTDSDPSFDLFTVTETWTNKYDSSITQTVTGNSSDYSISCASKDYVGNVPVTLTYTDDTTQTATVDVPFKYTSEAPDVGIASDAEKDIAAYTGSATLTASATGSAAKLYSASSSTDESTTDNSGTTETTTTDTDGSVTTVTTTTNADGTSSTTETTTTDTGAVDSTADGIADSATSTVSDTLAYQWYKGTPDSTTGGTIITGATGDTYTVSSLSDTNSYYCVVTSTPNATYSASTEPLSKTSEALYVKVMPWTISLTDSNSATVTGNSLSGGTTYTVSVTNSSDTTSTITVTASSGTVTSDDTKNIIFTTPAQAETAQDVTLTIKAGDTIIQTLTYTIPAKGSYIVTFYANGGSGTMASQTITESTETALSENTFIHTGYTFSGWSTAQGNDKTYDDKASVTLTANLTLYAVWTATSYTITYELNSGTNAVANPSSYSIESGIITLAAPTLENYTFDGWYTDSKYTTAIQEIDTTTTTGDITLYAKWTAPVTSTSAITVTIDATSDITVTSSKSGTDVTLTADSGYSSYTWTVNNVAQDSTTNTLTFIATSTAGVTYDVLLTAEKNGITYSASIQVVTTSN